ncbi:MAG: hypothetical protein CMG00_07860 [Candidatus Marinimicrobia bacterium]|nr:hypothetical protein [Candidatus Neomarinimicrobiota bacterium]
MIKINKLSKNYGDFKAVKSISFEINKGEIVGFLGSNGAGKSTTLKMITGFLTPTSGNIHVNGLNIKDSVLDIQKDIGYLPELNPLYTEMKVYDLLEFTANIRRISGPSFKKALTKVSDQCGLNDVMHKLVSECSKGYKQRIGLACSMIHDPSILILDEPVTGLDPNQIIEIRQLIKNLGKEKLVLMSSHILQEIQATVDRIIIINKGEIVADGSNDELLNQFKGKSSLKIETSGSTKKDLTSMCKELNLDVKNIEKKGKKHISTIDFNKSKDPREQIFSYAVKSKWIITEMTPQSAGLESIFRTLTTGNHE